MNSMLTITSANGVLAVDEAPTISWARSAEPGLHMTEGYVIGETDFECWDRLWKASPSDPEVDGEEWVTFSERIEEYFRSSYENFPDEFYFWNEFSDDRTLDLKIVKPSVLTARLLLDLQKYLQTHGQKMWRIRIPIYFKPNDPHRVIVVYPHAMDIPPLRVAARERKSPGPKTAAQWLSASDSVSPAINGRMHESHPLRL
jgi:hypothetical protein